MIRRDAGFSLLEVMVSMAVLGFIVLGLTQGLRFGVAAWDRQAREVLRRDDAGAVERVLRQLIVQADPGRENEPLPFRGMPGALLLRTALPSGAGQARPVETAIGVDSAHRLVLRWASGANARQQMLLDDVDRVEFAYWSSRGAGAWHREWGGTELPSLVRIRIVFRRVDRQMPPIIVAPARERLASTCCDAHDQGT